MKNEPLKIKKRGEDGNRIISVRIREDILQSLDKIANESNYSRNELINISVYYGLHYWAHLINRLRGEGILQHTFLLIVLRIVEVDEGGSRLFCSLAAFVNLRICGMSAIGRDVLG